MKKLSTKANFVLQIVFQILSLGIPLILTPYLSRTLGKTSLGIYSFSYSIATYFSLFINLGIQAHGSRTIAACRTVEEEKHTFFALQFIHTLCGLISILAFFLFSLIGVSSDKNIYFILIIFLLSSLFDTTWYYYGKQNFSSVIVKNTLIKIIEVVLIFIFVKTPLDLWKYALIASSSMFLGQFLLLPPIIHKLGFYFPNKEDLKKHVKPMIILAISVFAINVYALLDKTFIGLMINDNKESVALYDYAEKLVKLPVGLLGSLGTVLLPRISQLRKNGQKELMLSTLRKANILLCWLSVPCFFGLAAISKTLAPVYFGQDFILSGNYMYYLSPLALIIPFGATVRNSYMIPSGKDKEYLFSLFLAAITNLLLNITLIPVLKVYGAIIGTLAAEIFACVLQFWFCRKDLPVIKYLIDLIPFLVFGLIMYVVVFFFDSNRNKDWITIFLDVLIGIGVYLTLSFVFLWIWHKDLIGNVLHFKVHKISEVEKKVDMFQKEESKEKTNENNCNCSDEIK